LFRTKQQQSQRSLGVLELIGRERVDRKSLEEEEEEEITMAPNTTASVAVAGMEEGTMALSQPVVVEEASSVKGEGVMTRRRGEFDYHIMVTGGRAWSANNAWTETAIIQKNSTNVTELTNRGNLWGDTTVEVAGESKALILAGSPPSYGRRPNFRAADVGYRAMDGVLVVLKTGPYERTVDWIYETLERSFSGQNERYYAQNRRQLNHMVLDMYAEKKMITVYPASNVKVVSFLLVLDDTSFQNPSDYHKLKTVKESEQQLRKEIEKMQEKHGTEKVKLYTVSFKDKEEVLKDVLAKMCEDVDNQNGIRFDNITALSESDQPEPQPQFDSLNVVKKEDKAKSKKRTNTSTATSNKPFWKKIFA